MPNTKHRVNGCLKVDKWKDQARQCMDCSINPCPNLHDARRYLLKVINYKYMQRRDKTNPGVTKP